LPGDRERFRLDESKCGICHDRLIEGKSLTRLPCGHLYHTGCGMNWFLMNGSCPECRYELSSSSSATKENDNNRPTVKCACPSQSQHSCFFKDPTKSLQDQLGTDGEQYCRDVSGQQ